MFSIIILVVSACALYPVSIPLRKEFTPYGPRLSSNHPIVCVFPVVSAKLHDSSTS